MNFQSPFGLVSAPNCGPFNDIILPATGPLDECCIDHDNCYEGLGGGVSTYLDWNECDGKLLSCAANIEGHDAAVVRGVFKTKKRLRSEMGVTEPDGDAVMDGVGANTEVHPLQPAVDDEKTEVEKTPKRPKIARPIARRPTAGPPLPLTFSGFSGLTRHRNSAFVRHRPWMRGKPYRRIHYRSVRRNYWRRARPSVWGLAYKRMRGQAMKWRARRRSNYILGKYHRRFGHK